MRKTRLIFVEGIMGAGKTTTAQFITGQLEQHGIAAQFVLEGPTRDEPEHPLRVATSLPHPLAVWLDLTTEQYIELSLQKWQAFAREAQESTDVAVCDGLLFHGNMADLLLMDAEPRVLRGYVEEVLSCIERLHPVVIYFYQADIRQALRKACDVRGSAWEAYQVNWKVGSPYGTRRGLQGIEGLLQLYETYRAICDEIFATLTVPKVAIENANGAWDVYYDDILKFLQLPSSQRS